MAQMRWSYKAGQIIVRLFIYWRIDDPLQGLNAECDALFFELLLHQYNLAHTAEAVAVQVKKIQSRRCILKTYLMLTPIWQLLQSELSSNAEIHRAAVCRHQTRAWIAACPTRCIHFTSYVVDAGFHVELLRKQVRQRYIHYLVTA